MMISFAFFLTSPVPSNAAGVIPGRGWQAEANKEKRRLTLMVGFWEKLSTHQRSPDSPPGPAMVLPEKDDKNSRWLGILKLSGRYLHGHVGGCPYCREPLNYRPNTCTTTTITTTTSTTTTTTCTTTTTTTTTTLRTTTTTTTTLRTHPPTHPNYRLI